MSDTFHLFSHCSVYLVFFLSQEQSLDDTLISSLLSSRVLNAVVYKSPMLEQRLMALNVICKQLRVIGTNAIRGTRSYGLNFPKIDCTFD